MKNTLTALTLCALIASPSLADDTTEPVLLMDPMVIKENTGSASVPSEIIVPLIFVALIAAALLSDDSPLLLPSDERAKTDIAPVGTASNGLTLYQYRYTYSSMLFEGVMAQEVLLHTPDAVVVQPNGMMSVRYGTLGIIPRVID